MQKYRTPGQPLSGQMQAQLYYARKRRARRSEATVDKGGLRKETERLGVIVQVILKVGP